MNALIAKPVEGVPVAWAGSPFGAYTGDVFRDILPAGLSIAEIVDRVPSLPLGFGRHGVVCVNGEPVPREMWAFVRPKVSGPVPVAVTLHVPAGRGGGREGGGKNTFAIIAAIALIAITTVVSGGFGAGIAGGWFAAGSLSAKLLGTAVGIIGGLAITALSPPPALPKKSKEQGLEDSRESAAASGNVLSPGAQVPAVVGTFLVYPPFAHEPYVEIIDEDEYVWATYCLAGPHDLSDIRIGGVSVDDSEDVEVETREGWDDDTALTLSTRQGKMLAPQVELAGHRFDPTSTSSRKADLLDQSSPSDCLPTWISAVSRRAVDEVWLHVYCPGGLNDPAEPTEDHSVPIRVRMRQRGAVDWINLPELHLRGRNSGNVRKAIKFIWGSPPSPLPSVPTGFGWVLAYKETVGQSAVSPTTSAWTAHSHFSSGAGSDVMSSAGPGNVANTALYYDRAEFYLDEETFPKGVYEYQLKRGAAYESDDFTASTYILGTFGNVRDFFHYFEDSGPIYRAVRTSNSEQSRTILARVVSIWNEHPIGGTGLALISIKAKNRQLEPVSAIASRYVQDYDDDSPSNGWSDWVITDNPAPHLRDVLVGTLNKKPLSTSRVDDEGLLDWRERCTDEDFRVNAILESTSVADALALIASAGYGKPYKSEIWGVIQDRDRAGETPVQIFTPRNMANFRWQKVFADRPHFLVASYKDEDNDYQDTEVVVYADGYNPSNGEIPESVTYLGLTTEAEVVARANFDQRQAYERSTFYSGEAGPENIVCRRGDLVGVQHDILSRVAGFARVKEKIVDTGGDVIGLVLDSVIPATSDGEGVTVDELMLLSGDAQSGTDQLIFSGDESGGLIVASTSSDSVSMGVALRLKDGTVLIKAIDETAETDEITFTTPFPDPGGALSANCLVTSGPLGEEYRELVVADITHSRDLTASLSFVDVGHFMWGHHDDFDDAAFSGAFG